MRFLQKVPEYEHKIILQLDPFCGACLAACSGSVHHPQLVWWVCRRISTSATSSRVLAFCRSPPRGNGASRGGAPIKWNCSPHLPTRGVETSVKMNSNESTSLSRMRHKDTHVAHEGTKPAKDKPRSSSPFYPWATAAGAHASGAYAVPRNLPRDLSRFPATFAKQW